MKVLLLLIFTLGFWVTNAQEKELVMDYHRNFKKSIFKNPDSAFFHIKQLKLAAETSKHFLPSYYYHQDLGQYYFVRQVMDSSEYHYKKALEISSKEGETKLSIDSEIWLANHAHFKGEAKKSMALWTNVLHSSEDVNYIEGIGNAYAAYASNELDVRKKIDLFLKVDSLFSVNNYESAVLVNIYGAMAKIYMESAANEELAKDYINKALALSKKLHYPFAEFGAYTLLAENALEKTDYDEAIHQYKKLLKLGNSLDDQSIKDRAIIGLIKTFFNKGDQEKTAEYFKKGAYLLHSKKGLPLLGWIHLLWTERYIAQDHPQKAFIHLEQSRLNPDVTSPFAYKRELYRVEIKYFELIKNFEKAYETKKKYEELLSQLTEQRNTDGFLLSEQRKDKEKKEQEISLLKSQNELTIQKQKNQRNILLGGIGLTSLLGILLFILYRNRQKTNKKLREIDALKTNFFTNISHEFRTPLTLISSPIQETLAEPNLSTKKRDHFEMASQNTTRLLSLVDQLLDLSKIDSGNTKIQLEYGTATLYIAAWATSFEYLAKQKEIDLHIEVKNKEFSVWFDKDVLEKITTNLLGNAIKYTPKFGKIHLTATIEKEQLLLKIENTGPGLTKAQLTNIFKRFYQSNDHSDGAGVGLSLVKELTTLHQGSINASSETGIKTSFKVALCIDKNKFKNANIIEAKEFQNPEIRIPYAKPSSNGTLNTQKKEDPILLIVEDNEDLRTLVSDLFQEDYQIITAENGAVGVAVALEQIPDLIISDVMMPIKDGIALTKELKEDERTSHIPIILLTAKTGDKNKLTGIDVGADDYISKPFNQKILKSKAMHLIALRKKLRSRYSQEVILKPKDIAITSVDEQFLEKMQIVLDRQLVDSSFSAAAFSKALHMSRMQLHRKLKALTGLTTTEFIRSQRLKLAVQILKDSDINVSEVGYSVGFNDHAYFTKCFKEVYQATPSEYAKRA